SVLKEIDIDHLDRGYNFENDMLVHLNIIGASVRDVACSIRYDGTRKSGINPLRFLGRSIVFLTRRYFYRILRKYIIYDFGAYPMLFFPGLFIFLVGLWFGGQ